MMPHTLASLLGCHPQSLPSAPDSVPKRWALQHPDPDDPLRERRFLPEDMPLKPVSVSAEEQASQMEMLLGMDALFACERACYDFCWRCIHRDPRPGPPSRPLLRRRAACRCPSRTTTATAACLSAASSSSSRTACREVSSASWRRDGTAPPPPHLPPASSVAPPSRTAHPCACLPLLLPLPAEIRWRDIDELKDYAKTNRDLFNGTADCYPGACGGSALCYMWWRVGGCSSSPLPLHPDRPPSPPSSAAGLLTEHWFMPANASRLRLNMRRLILGLMAVSECWSLGQTGGEGEEEEGSAADWGVGG